MAASASSKRWWRRRTGDKRGVSVVEVLVALSIGGIIVASVGSLLINSKRLTGVISLRQQAVALAQDELERAELAARDAFACSLPGGGSPPCVKSGQSCTPNAGYTSCWIEFTGVPTDPFHVDGSGAIVAGTESVPGGVFTRQLTITNLADPGGGKNIKRLSVTISWTERGVAKTLTSSTILTAWKNV